MAEQIKYLGSHPEISEVLAEGFAHIYHSKPEFPISFLAQYLKNHEQLKHQKKELIRKLVNNQTLSSNLKKEEEKRNKDREAQQEKLKYQRERQEGFEFRIKESNNHEEILNQFCEWIEKERNLTGVYIGEFENQTKNVDLLKEDGEEIHIDAEAPKIFRFKAASNSHNLLMIGKTLPQDSVVGKLITEKPDEAGGQQEQGKEKVAKPKGEVYIPLVQQNKELTFFKYPRLGSFYAVVMRVKSYLHEKIFDANIVKTEAYRKTKEEYEKQLEERENKFRALYDERSVSGADEKELEELEQTFEKEEEAFPKPKQEEFQFIMREFVVCFDTLGIDREINAEDREYCRRLVEVLRNSWQEKEKELLRKDIDSQLKLITDNLQNPQAETLARLVEEEDKELPSNEEVEKHKTNEKLAELQMNTLRIEKVKEYMSEEKYIPYLEILLDRRVIKYAEIMKIFYLFADFKKEEINFKGTNVINWLKTKALLSKENIIEKINHFVARGSKPLVEVLPYSKWQRLLKNLEKYDQTVVASYNIYLAFILRFLQLSGKVRIADNQARKATAKAEREAREEKIKEAEQKAIEKQEKMGVAKSQAEAKEQQFDEEAWIKAYDEEFPPIEIGQEVVEEQDRDLQIEVVEAAPQ